MQILARTTDIVIVNKPAGMAVHPGWVADHAATVIAVLASQLGQKIYPAHRLDRPTSGCLCVALNPDAARTTQAAFQIAHGAVEAFETVTLADFDTTIAPQLPVRKRYLTVAVGRLPEEHATPGARWVLDHAIPGEPGAHGKARVRAVTVFEHVATVMEEIGPVVTLACEPLTGRTHQIRRHVKHQHLRMVGDVNYGEGPVNRWFRDHGIHRLMLHAESLTVPGVTATVKPPWR
jgi:tRNA pseudouridine65 synthase